MGTINQAAIGEMFGWLVWKHCMEWVSSGMGHSGATGSGCRTTDGPSGCPTVHSFLHDGWS